MHGEVHWSSRRAVSYDEKLWGVPFYSKGWAWLVRGDVLETLRIDEPKSYADALQIVARLGGSPRATAPWFLPLTADLIGEAQVNQAIAAFDGATADGSGLRVVVSSQQAASALDALAAMARASSVALGGPPDALSAVTAFEAGRLAMIPGDAAYYTRLTRGPDPAPWAAKSLRVTVPLLGAKLRYTSAQARYFVVSRTCSDPDRASDAIASLLSPAPLRQAMVKCDGLVIPAYSNYLHDPFWDNDPARQVFVANVRGDNLRQMALVDFGHAGPATVQSATLADRGHLREALRRVLEDGIPATEALKECQQRGEQTYQDAARAYASVSRRTAPPKGKLFGVLEW